MKIEFRIARGNVKDWKEIRITKDGNSNLICKEHKLSCERWLGFCKKEINNPYFWRNRKVSLSQNVERLIYNIQEKIKDLEEAIKHYEDNEISS
ncbi:hypothetical protein LCGC14_0465670 [marine sediment metagenome]|uniref:Uncharacterized protein n=1 Tax=marine sediment metagenome TaxID=412755 RepID=A0A0F9VMJ3_9ZZZZ